MSDAPASVRASPAKRPKSAPTRHADAESLLLTEFEAMMERSSKKLEKLNADLDAMLSRMDSTRLRT